MIRFASELLLVDPGFGTLTLVQVLAFALLAKEQPHAGHHVAGVDNVKDQPGERSEIILSFLRVLLERTSQNELERLSQSINMGHSEQLEPIVAHWLTHHKFGNCSCNVKEEVAENVVLSNTLNVLMGSGFLEHVQDNLQQVNNVDDQFNFIESWLLFQLIYIAEVLACRVCRRSSWAILVDILENENEWHHDK